MNTPESKIHDMLLELSPDAIDSEEQARIVAVASDIYRHMERQAKTKRRTSTASINESMMMDSVLQAMGQLSHWSGGESLDMIDVNSMSPSEIVKIASSSAARFGSVGYYGNQMDIINDDLDALITDDVEYSFDRKDSKESDPTLPNGYGRHWTDSRAR